MGAYDPRQSFDDIICIETFAATKNWSEQSLIAPNKWIDWRLVYD
jgi:hypothetical protein